eukprot:scaffold966_cov47-Cyclotella_meneghiniana.AAC.3
MLATTNMISCIIVWTSLLPTLLAFQPLRNVHQTTRPRSSSTILFTSLTKTITEEVDFNDLTIMDVVLFRRRQDNENKLKLELGTLQEETRKVAPLSAWTTDSSYISDTNDMMEFVVDEEDMFPGLTSEDIIVLDVLEGSVIGYGSRQVGGGKGLGNPHGEESELLYYIDRRYVEGKFYLDIDEQSDEMNEMKIELVVNPSLEVIW